MNPDPSALRRLGRSLTATEAKGIADRLEAGRTLTTALSHLPATRRGDVRDLLEKAVGPDARDAFIIALRVAEGARSMRREVTPLWTMPGHVAHGGPLTTSVVDLVEGARTSVVCSTYNFQTTSGLWKALKRACGRDGVELCLYVDSHASIGGLNGPSPHQVAMHLPHASVFASKEHDGKHVTNHAKFVSVDHRFLIVTSANFSWSAENHNVELGVRIDDHALAVSVEQEMVDAQPVCYRRVPA